MPGRILRNGTNTTVDLTTPGYVEIDATGGGGGGALDDLTDVTITAPSSGEVLKYDGTGWVNDTDAPGADVATQAELDAHVNDTTAAHAASAISYAGGTGMAATDVEAAIDELATEKLSLVAAGAAVENLGAVEFNVNVVAATGAAETLDTSVYSVHDCTMDQACEFTFSNPAPSGKLTEFVLILRGAFTPTFPASVDWAGGAAPTYATPSKYVFSTVDAGTTYMGTLAGSGFA